MKNIKLLLLVLIFSPFVFNFVFGLGICVPVVPQGHKIIDEIKVDENPSHLITRDNLLFLSHQESALSFKESNIFSVIDPQQRRVTKKIEILRPEYVKD